MKNILTTYFSKFWKLFRYYLNKHIQSSLENALVFIIVLFLVLSNFYHGIHFYVYSGVGGNLVAIQASRMSTYLHYWSVPGALPFKMNGNCPGPCATFCSSGQKQK